MSKGSARRPGIIPPDAWEAIFNRPALAINKLANTDEVQEQVDDALADIEVDEKGKHDYNNLDR